MLPQGRQFGKKFLEGGFIDTYRVENVGQSAILLNNER